VEVKFHERGNPVKAGSGTNGRRFLFWFPWTHSVSLKEDVKVGSWWVGFRAL